MLVAAFECSPIVTMFGRMIATKSVQEASEVQRLKWRTCHYRLDTLEWVSDASTARLRDTLSAFWRIWLGFGNHQQNTPETFHPMYNIA